MSIKICIFILVHHQPMMQTRMQTQGLFYFYRTRVGVFFLPPYIFTHYQHSPTVYTFFKYQHILKKSKGSSIYYVKGEGYSIMKTPPPPLNYFCLPSGETPIPNCFTPYCSVY